MSNIIFYALTFLFFIIGVFVSAYTLLPTLIIVFFGIPFTLELNKKGIMNSYVPIKKYAISLLLLPTILFIISFVIFSYSSNYFYAFVIGSILVLAFGIGKCGKNPNNIADYLRTNGKFIDQKKIDS